MYRTPRTPAIYTFLLTLILMVTLQVGVQGQYQQISDQPSAAPRSRKELPKGGAIRGKVIGADTGAGLRKVTLMLRGTQSQTGDNRPQLKPMPMGDTGSKTSNPGNTS